MKKEALTLIMKKINKGIGIDLIEIDRIRNSIEKFGQDFLDRIFTVSEQNYCNKYKDPAPSFAGRFAAKEAVAKALGTGLGKSLSFLDIEILNDSDGTPFVTLSENAIKIFEDPHILISISHCHCHATAIATNLKRYSI
jgi:holo-[acyl-carrier protein] synthase